MIILNEQCAEAALEEMARAFVAAVERLRVDAVQLSHAAREVRLRRLEEQVVVVSHQAVREDAPPVARDGVAEQLEEAAEIGGVPENAPPLVAA
jgi:hypothetical protein